MSPELVLSRVLGVPRAEIADDTSNASHPAWDSLTHIQVVVALESEYRVSLTAGEAMEVTNVAAIKQLLRGRGVEW